MGSLDDGGSAAEPCQGCLMELALAPCVIVVNGHIARGLVNETRVDLCAALNCEDKNATSVPTNRSSDSLCFLHMRDIILC